MSDATYKTCPWCDETDFDLVGLKSHLLHGDCEPFDETENIIRTWVWERCQDNTPGVGLVNDVVPPDRVEDGAS